MRFSSRFVALAFACFAVLTAHARAQISLDFSVSEGVGYTFSSADGLELQSTIVQSETSEMRDGATAIQMGFWAIQTESTPCPADFNRDGGVDGADVQGFFESWEQSLVGADVNFDGGVDGADVEYFFEVWERGAC